MYRQVHKHRAENPLWLVVLWPRRSLPSRGGERHPGRASVPGVLILAVVVGVLSGCVMPPAATPSAAAPRVSIYAPSTTSSIPVILAAAADESADLTIFSNHSQANTLFLRGDIDILVTGLSVGVGFVRNGAPVQAINCNVSGVTYLVTYGRQVDSFAELKGESVYVPFESSPIEEVTRYFAEQEGLVWKQDIQPVYAASDSALTLLTEGKATAVALPEPLVSLAEKQPNVYVSLSYRGQWDALTGSDRGYPQVCAFVRQDWAAGHGDTIARFNAALADAIRAVERDPAAAATRAEDALGFKREILLSALGRTDFDLVAGAEMAQEVRRYYEIVGKPLDAAYDSFFYAAGSAADTEATEQPVAAVSR